MARTHMPSRAVTVDDEIVATLPATITGDIAAVAARIISRAEAMGLIRPLAEHGYDRALLLQAVDAFGSVGIGRQHVIEADVASNLRGALEFLNDAIEHSPNPTSELPSMTGVLGAELVTRLLGISESSVRRYTTSERPVPDDVAHRLHFITLVAADLLGSYNSYGVRRWFDRPRRALHDQSPAAVLAGDWTPEDPSAGEVAALARSLTGLGAA